MNLEKLKIFHDKCSDVYLEPEIKTHSELTSDVAIYFLEWQKKNAVRHGDGYILHGCISFHNTEELFDYFINNVYKPE